MNKPYRYFLMVAREGNIKAASEKLHISQPSLTAAIKKLELDIGVDLFIRRSKGVELTNYGRLFQEHVQEQQEKHAHLMHKFTDMQQRHFGKIKLGTGEAWWEGFVRSSVKTYQDQSPGCAFHLEFGNNLSLIHHLVQGDIDLFVGHEVNGLHERCRVNFQPLFQEKEALYVRKGHPLLSCNLSVTELIERQKDFPLLRVTPDHARHHSVLADHLAQHQMIRKDGQDNRLIYDVDAVPASIDMLNMTDAVMPYSSEMQRWMESKGIETLLVNEDQIGNVGIYTKQGHDDEKISLLIDLIKQDSLERGEG